MADAPLKFSGEVARLYHEYRRGYPAEAIDAIVEAFGLSPADAVVDLGCGTGQLTVPLAARVGAAVGVDPERDMLDIARQHGAGNITWMLGSDRDLPAIAATLRPRPLGAVTAATSLHWMDSAAVFDAARSLIRPGGGVAVVTNGKPLWRLDIEWSRALRAFLERWNGRPAKQGCGTDDLAQRRYREHLVATGFAVTDRHVRYTDDLDLDRLVGAVLSAFAEDMLPAGDDRARFRDQLSEAVGDGPYSEPVDVGIMLGVR